MNLRDKIKWNLTRTTVIKVGFLVFSLVLMMVLSTVGAPPGEGPGGHKPG
ncbi:MAG: hypothetical protein ACXADY_08700 [Candidatus Hodarchaeales archaeon]|jgi:hypothetical protein